MRYQMIDASVVVMQLTGDVLVVDKQGVTHSAKIGEHLPAGSMLILEGGAKVALEPDVSSSSIAQPAVSAEPSVTPEEIQVQMEKNEISPVGMQGATDVAEIQKAIMEGVDPTLNFEATAAGGAPGAGGGGATGSGNGGFVSVERTGASTLATAGFDTSYNNSSLISVTRAVIIQDGNDTPSLNVEPGNNGENDRVFEAGLPQGSEAGDGTTVAVGSFTLSDADGLSDLKTVSLNGTSFAIENLIGAVVAGSHGNLTVTGYNSTTGVATYQYELTSTTTDGPGAENDVFTLSVSDGSSQSVPASITIDIIDDVPLAVADNNSVAEDGDNLTISGGVVANDLHANGQPGADVPVSFVGWLEPVANYGSFVDLGNGQYQYTLNNGLAAVQALDVGQTLTEQFSYQIQDGDGDPSTTTLTITIQGSNDTPTLNVEPGNNGENDRVFEAGLPQGSEAGDGTTVAVGSFTLSDADGLSDLKTVSLNGTSFAIENLIGAVVAGSHGNLTVTGYNSTTGVATYQYELTSTTTDGPGAENDVFTLSVSDGSSQSAPASITIDIIDDVPLAVADNNSVAEDGDNLTISGGVVANDLHANGQPGADVPVSFVGWLEPVANYGSFVDLGNGQYQYTLNNGLAAVQALDVGQTLTEQFSYQIQDGDGDPSTTTLTITIQGSNDTPSLNVEPGNNGENDRVFEAGLPQGSEAGDGTTVAVGSFTLSDADGLSDLKTVSLNGTSFAIENLIGAVVAGSHGNLTVTGYNSTTGVATYQYELTSTTTDGPGAENDVFTLSVSDGSSQSAPASITIDIIDDVPLAVADNNSVAEDGDNLTISGGVVANDLHANGQPGADVPVSFVGWLEPVANYGSFVDLGNGQYQYTLNNGLAAVQALDVGQTLTEQFSYQIQDGDGDPSTTTLTITIQGSNDTPTLNVEPGNNGENDRVFEAGLPQGSEAGDGTTVAVGSFTLSDADGLSDLKTVSLNGTSFAIENLIGAVVAGSHGNLTVTGYNSTTGVATYQYELTSTTTDGPGAENDVFTLSVSDGSSQSVPASITIDIIDDVPLAVADNNSVAEDGDNLTISGGVVANDLHANGQPGADVPVSFVGWLEPVANYGSFVDLGNGQYQYTLNNGLAAVQALDVGQTLTEQFSYQIQDGDGDPSTTTLTITIQGSNDTPTLNVEPGNNGENDRVFEAGLPQGSEAGDGTTVAVGSFTLSDADGLSDLKTVSLNGTSFAIENLIGAVVAGSHGNLTVTGYNSTTGVATYQYELTSTTTDGPGAENDVFTLSVSDGSSQSAPASITIDIIDDVPLAVADNNSVAEDGDNLTISGGVVANDLHANGQPGADVPVSFVGWLEPVANYGSFVDLGNGQYQYTLNNGLAAVQALDVGQTLTEQFSYQIQDGDGDPSTTTLTITIQGSNDTPTLNVEPGNNGENDRVFEAGLPQGSEAGDGTTVAVGSFTLSDADGLSDLKTVSLNGTSFAIENLIGAVVAGSHGNLTVTGYNSTTGVATYQYELTSTTTDGPGAENDVFTLSVSDGSSQSAPASITIDIIDDVPLAVADNNSVAEDGDNLTISGGVVANDLHANGQPGADVPVSFVGWLEPVANYGSFVDLGNGQYQYTLNNGLAAVQALDVGQTLTEQFSYQIQDGDGDPSTTTLTITIQGSNDTPSLNVEPGNNGENDRVFEAGLPQGSEAGDGTTVAVGSFTLSDADGLSDLKTVSLNGTSFAIENLIGAVVAGSHGNLTVTGYNSTTGVATYQYELTSTTTDGPGAENDVFTLSVSDGSSQSAPASITIDIIDDVPLAVADNNSIAEDGDNLTISGGVVTNDLHANGQPGADVPVSFVGWLEPVANYGSFVDLGNGQYQYTLNNGLAAVQALDVGQTLTEQFSYQIQDGDGDPSTTTLTITILGSNDTPTLNVEPGNNGENDRVFEAGLPQGSEAGDGTTVAVGSFTLSDADGLSDLKTVSLNGTSFAIENLIGAVVAGSHGNLTVTGYNSTTGVATYQYELTSTTTDGPGAENDVFTLSVSDGSSQSAPASITIDIIDDVPLAVADNNSVAEDGDNLTISGGVVTNDLHANGQPGADMPVSFVGWIEPVANYGSFVDLGNGQYQYTLNNGLAAVQALDVGQTLTEQFSYQIQDGDGDPSTTTLTITILGSNDAPTISVSASELTVSEAGLPTGSDSASTSVFTTGQFVVGDTDGLDDISSITIAGTTLAISSSGLAGLVNSTIDTGYGSLLLTSYSNGTFNYQYTLTDPVDNDSTLGADTNGYTETVALSVSDGVSSANTSFGIFIVDDVPKATDIVHSQQATAGVNTNLLITLDVSGSMGWDANFDNLTRLEVAKQAILELFEQYEAQGNVRVKIITFSASGSIPGSSWQTISEAKTSLLSLSSNGGTNYDDALIDTMTAYAQAGKLTGAQNVAYFLSDGEPTLPSNSEGINSTEEQSWTNFLNNNDIHAYALGMGDVSNASALNPIAYDGIGSGTNTNSQIITDLSQLTSTLVTIAHASSFSGVLTSGGGFGADGGYVESIVVGGITYSFDGSTVHDSDNGALNNATYDSVTHILTVTSVTGGKIAVNMDSGSYQYSPPSSITTIVQELIGVTLIDNDGDKNSASLQILVDPAATPLIIRDDIVVSNANAVSGNDQVVIPEWALLANDTGNNSSLLTISSVVNAVGGIIANTTGLPDDVTFTESTALDSNGGSFSYTPAIGSSILADLGDVTIDRSQAGQSSLDGTYLNEILLGRDGYDDTINGNSGDDILIGLGGDDILKGGYGDDILDGGLGNDTINGQSGLDTATYIDSSGSVTIRLAVTTAQNTGGAGTDTLSNIENLIGSNYADNLTGNNAANVISGGAGNDTISGGGGEDILRGGLGADILTGGNGADVFKLMAADKDLNVDTIKDFTLNQDKLDLSDVLNDPTVSLSNYLDVKANGNDAVVNVYSSGNAATGVTSDYVIILEGLGTDLQDLQDYLHGGGVIK